MNMSCNILVLDDHVDVAEGVGEILELCGFQVSLAHDGPSAISTYDNGNIDIGLFDIRMPGMNGVEAFLEVKKRHPEASVIMMSGYADESLIECAINNGALGLLEKPFEPNDLLARVREIASTSVSELAD